MVIIFVVGALVVLFYYKCQEHVGNSSGRKRAIKIAVVIVVIVMISVHCSSSSSTDGSSRQSLSLPS